MGVDPEPGHIERAEAQAARYHWAGESWRDHLRFVCADFSGLTAAGLEERRFDVVVVNSVLNLAPDHEAALVEIARLLVPGGYLYHDAVLADEVLPANLAERCRAKGNVFGTAPSRDELAERLGRAGFLRWKFAGAAPLTPARGDAIDDLAGHAFCSAVVQAWV